MKLMHKLLAALVLLAPLQASGGTFVHTPYSAPKVVFDFFLDEPEKIGTALFWLRATLNPLTEAPYDMAPEMMDVVVIIHGTEIVSTVKHNYEKYRDAVERMKYYHQLGVKFRVCALAAEDYGYQLDDFHDFIEVVPSAMAELIHWQQQGHALLRPLVFEKKHDIQDIR